MPSHADQLRGLVTEVWSDCFCYRTTTCAAVVYGLDDVCIQNGDFRGMVIFGCAGLRWSVGRSSYDGGSFFLLVLWVGFFGGGLVRVFVLFLFLVLDVR